MRIECENLIVQKLSLSGGQTLITDWYVTHSYHRPIRPKLCPTTTSVDECMLNNNNLEGDIMTLLNLCQAAQAR